MVDDTGRCGFRAFMRNGVEVTEAIAEFIEDGELGSAKGLALALRNDCMKVLVQIDLDAGWREEDAT